MRMAGPEHDAAVGGLVRLDRLTVERDHAAAVAGETETENARVGGVDRAAAGCARRRAPRSVRHPAVDGDCIADRPLWLMSCMLRKSSLI